MSDILPLYSVSDCLWPSEVIQFWLDSWTYRPHMFSECVRFVYKFNLVTMCDISRGMGHRKVSNIAKVNFKVTQGHCCWCYSISHIWFPTNLPLQLCLCLVPFPRYPIIIVPYLPEHTPFVSIYHECASTSYDQSAYYTVGHKKEQTYFCL